MVDPVGVIVRSKACGNIPQAALPSTWEKVAHFIKNHKMDLFLVGLILAGIGVAIGGSVANLDFLTFGGQAGAWVLAIVLAIKKTIEFMSRPTPFPEVAYQTAEDIARRLQ